MLQATYFVATEKAGSWTFVPVASFFLRLLVSHLKMNLGSSS
jgi:hypothetical protein